METCYTYHFAALQVVSNVSTPVVSIRGYHLFTHGKSDIRRFRSGAADQRMILMGGRAILGHQ